MISSLLVIPPVFFNFTIVMAFPPHFDPSDQSVMRDILKKYPHGGKKAFIEEGSITSAADLPSSKLRILYKRRTPWATYELNMFSPRFFQVINWLKKCRSAVTGSARPLILYR